jgi:purine-nucleoside phosphorylase
MSGAAEFSKADDAARFIRERCGTPPQVAVVLGSGLGDFAETLTDAVRFDYRDLPHWPPSKVIGHAGRLVVGTASGRRIAALAGRVHLYEGHSAASVAFATRVMARLGVGRIVLTNAAGGINTAFAQGSLMIIEDHINLLGANPLTGENDERLGVRFPDMTEVYSRSLRAMAADVAAGLGIDVQSGVYVAVPGPSYETPAEIRFLRAIGADAVGMSTVPEAIAARHAGLEVLGISCISNMAAGVLPHPLDHTEVLETTRRVRGAFIALLEGVIARM